VDLAGKRLEVLKEAFPEVRRVAIVYYPQSPGEVIQFANAEKAARALGMEARAVELRNADEGVAVITAVQKSGADSIVFVGSTLLRVKRRQLVEAVSKTRLPAIYVDNAFTEVGGLLSYGQDISENFRQAAGYVDRILKGMKPGDLPIEQPTRLELIVNLKTAKAQAITIPRSILLRADKILE
jgi:putative ABC transport system substrate-binding protein